MTPWRLLALLLALPLLGCPPTGTSDDDDAADDDDSAADDDDATPVDFRVWSPDFVDPYFDNPHDCPEALALDNACGGSNPEIAWEGAPEGTVAFALVFDDPSFFDYEHWAIFNIPGDATGLDGGISGNAVTNSPPGDAVELVNGAGFSGYFGSCPQTVNEYRWRLWALEAELDPTLASWGAVIAAAEAASLEMVETCSVFDGAELPAPGR